MVKYAQNKHYKIIGSVMVGIELIKLPKAEEYRPHFVIYSLWGNKKLVRDIFSQIKKRSWDLNHFALWSIKYEEWLKSVENKITNKSEILSRLETNKRDKKLEKLQLSELN